MKALKFGTIIHKGKKHTITPDTTQEELRSILKQSPALEGKFIKVEKDQKTKENDNTSKSDESGSKAKSKSKKSDSGSGDTKADKSK